MHPPIIVIANTIALSIAVFALLYAIFRITRRAKDDSTESSDLTALDLGDLAHKKIEAQDIAKIYDLLIKKARESERWYYDKRKTPRFWARVFRAIALLGVVIGGLMPILIPVVGTMNLTSWGYLALAVAGSAMACNRSMGASSSWIRYLEAATDIKGTIAEFEMNWLKLRQEEDIVKQLDALIAFSNEVNTLVENETKAWKEQFQSDLNMLLQMIKSPQDVGGRSEKGGKKPASATSPGPQASSQK